MSRRSSDIPASCAERWGDDRRSVYRFSSGADALVSHESLLPEERCLTSYRVLDAAPTAGSVITVAEATRRARAPRAIRTTVVAIDGLAGAGKSTFAALLAPLLEDAHVVPTDDFSNWDNVFGWAPALIEKVLIPFSRGEPARYARSDWGDGPRAPRDIKPGRFVLLEGVSASRAEFRPYLACTVWVEAPREARWRRGLERDGPQAADLWRAWMAEEDAYVKEEQPQLRADFVIDGGDSAWRQLR